MQTHVFQNLSLNAVNDLAVRVAAQVDRGDVLFLNGDLGAGKTQFAKFFIQHLMQDTTLEIPSPTFTLVQTYEAPDFEIAHFDLYRIEDEDEIEAIGLDDAIAEGVCLIEWPIRLGTYTPRTYLNIAIIINGDQTRNIEITCHGARWEGVEL